MGDTFDILVNCHKCGTRLDKLANLKPIFYTVALKTWNDAWCIGADSGAHPVGSLTLENCSGVDGGNGNAGMWQRYPSAVAVSSTGCTWNGKPYVAR